MKLPARYRTFLLIVFFITSFFITGSAQLSVAEEENRFSLYNNSTFSPGDEVTINLSLFSKGDSKFEFKLLKISDPVEFFSLLEQNNSRNSFDIWGKDKSLLLKYTQLVKKWTDHLPFRRNQYYSGVKVGKIDQAGIYIVQALRNDQVAYCAVVVTDYALVYKNTQKEILAFIANAKTGEFVKNSRFDFYHSGKKIGSKKSDKDGLIFENLANLDLNNESSVLLFGYSGKEIILSDPYFYFNQTRDNYLNAYVYTQQPVYRPGQEVNFKAIFRKKQGNDIKNIPGEEFEVKVKSPRNKEVYSAKLKTNDFGTISGSFILDEEADLGYYSIILLKDGLSYYGSFSVEEYKKPEYKVELSTDKNQYVNGDKIAVSVSAAYYFGSEVKNAGVKVNIYKQHYWRPWWYWSEWAWFYKGILESQFFGGQQELIYQQSGEFDENGKFNFEYMIDSDGKSDYRYVISAEVTDASRRAVNGEASVFVTRGSFTLSTTPERYFYEDGQDVKIKVNASDFSDKPKQTDFRIIIHYPQGRYIYSKKVESDTIFSSTNESGSALVTFKPKYNVKGYFNYSVVALDEKKREIETSNSFYIGDVNSYYQRTNAGVEIVTDKEAYEKGDSLIAYIFLPDENQELLLTYETNKIISYKKLKPHQNSFQIREKLTSEFSPSFNITISFLKDRMFYQTSKMIGVLAKDRLLNISLYPSKKIFKPGEEAEYRIVVKDNYGNPVKNTEVSLGIVDESIYAIAEDKTQSIENFFYSPQYFYIQTYNSLEAGYFSSYSRQATYIDKNYFSYKNDLNDHTGRLYGKMRVENEDNIPAGLFVILSGEKNYYTAEIDSTGYFDIKNISAGDYQLFVSSELGGMILIDNLKISKERQYNFTVKDEQKEKIENVIAQRNNYFTVEDGMVENETVALRSSGQQFAMSKVKKDSDLNMEFVQAELRSNFVDALIWEPNIITDRNGKATVKFKIPDNLTTWRTTVKGITKETEVGQRTDNFISRKDLLVRMETPRFFRKDDEVIISTIVHNYLSERKITKIQFEGEGIKLLSSNINSKNIINRKGDFPKNEYQIGIPSNDELRIDWKIRVIKSSGDAELKISALTNEESDAMEVKVPIVPNGIKISSPVVLNYSQSSVDEATEFDIDEDIDINTASFSFQLSPSLAGTILQSLDDLAGYPYGCVEQTMSRFLPTLIVANTFKEINVPLKSKTIEELPKYVEAGLKRLYDFQHPDGGWGWWTNDKTHPYMTAYVVYGMSLAKGAGFKIDNNVYNKGLANLKDQILNAKSDIDETTLAYMLFALSNADKNISYNDGIFNDIIDIILNKNLESYPLSLLALTLNNFNEKAKAKDIIGRLTKLVDEEKSFAFWSGQEWHYRWQDDNVQGTAFAVKAILNVDGNSDLITKAVRWLIMKRQGYSWKSTQETAVSLFALTDYLKITKELDPDYSVKVFINDKEIFSTNFSDKNIYDESKLIKINGPDDKILKKGHNKIRIEKSGSGVLYFSGINEFYKENLTSIQKNNGFNIRREYYVLDPTEKDGEIIFNKNKFSGTVISGQEIFVKTFVESKSGDLDYFILEDMLPSGFEIIKDMDKYVIDGENNYQSKYRYYDYLPWRWNYADREYRDEKVAFFVTNCQQKMEFSYIIKAQIPGDYIVMPAQGCLMYYPELNGRSDVIDVKVKDTE